jgi:predicted O-linked N-acetylglucosamine transferase (SPINDLY family)
MTTAPKLAAPDAAIEQHRRAIRLNPRNANAHAMLGLALQERGELAQAVASQRRALALDPSLTSLHSVMAPALHVLGENAAAADSYRRALAEQPGDADLHKGLGQVLLELGQLDGAVASAGKAAALRPDDLAIQLTLAAAQFRLRDYEAAAGSYRRVLELAPEHLDARFDLGQTLLRHRKYEEGAACFRQLLELSPDYARAYNHLGACLRELKQLDAAVAIYEQALQHAPNDPVTLHDMGVTLHLLGKLERAGALLERALAEKPDYNLYLTSMAANYFDRGLWEQALRHMRRALEVAPSSASTHSSVLFMLSHYTDDPAELNAEHFRFGDVWEAPYRGQWAPHPNPRDPERRLRVGFVSADLYQHAVARFVEPVFRGLKDSTQLTIHIYYNNVVEDDITRGIRANVAHWVPIADLDDDAVERQIRADGIDILIDLSGHSASNRLPLFARKPAPVQASWVGYAGTTGLQAMDYYVSDQFHLPEGRYDDQFTEKIVRLPLGAPFAPEPDAPPVNALPALTNGYLTFGSFHRPSKLSRKVIALWAKLLRGVPDSKLVLGGTREGADKTLLGWFDEEGIDRNRLLLRERTSVIGFLAQHHEVDVCLSPFPYTGSTTLLHALWMGVPTLTTIGPTNPSHAAVCPLAHVGLSSFIADDEAVYVTLGGFLSENVAVLAQLRQTMRERFINSVQGYPGVSAASLEHGLRLMWQRWCAGLPPAPLKVRLSDLAAPEAQESVK